MFNFRNWFPIPGFYVSRILGSVCVAVIETIFEILMSLSSAEHHACYESQVKTEEDRNEREGKEEGTGKGSIFFKLGVS